MENKKILTLFISIMTLMVLGSCKKEKSAANLIPSNLIDYMSVRSKNYEGGITIGNSCQGFGQSHIDHSIVYVQGYVNNIFEAFSVGDISIKQDRDNYFNIGYSKELYSLFGKKVNISLKKSDFLRSGNEFDGSINLPVPVQVTSPIGIVNSSQPAFISKTQTIRWVANSNSPRAINIVIDYTEQHPLNTAFQDFPRVKKLIETEDDGEYQFKPSDFTDIPLGACIQIMVGRGDYTIPANSTGQNYLITTYALSKAEFRLQN